MILEAFLITLAISIDALASGFAYGAQKIKIPIKSALVITFIGSFFLGVSLFFGAGISGFVSPHVAVIISSVILFTMGTLKIIGSIRSIKKAMPPATQAPHLSLLCTEPCCRPSPELKTVSLKEATILAVALSLDALAVGVGTGVTSRALEFFALVIGISLVMDVVMILLGAFIGNKVAKFSKINLSWLGGLVLIGVGIMNLL